MSGQARSAGVRDWSPEQLVYRQTYIDLIRCYLAGYGTQRDLARALGLSEPYVTYLLEPARRSGAGPREHWSALLTAAGHEAAEVFKYVKTPSETRAAQIAATLGCDGERREALLAYVRLARRARSPTRPERPLPVSQASAALRVIGDIHQAALYSTTALETASSYVRVWELARGLPAAIDADRAPAEFAQALMFLHDTAQALGRPELALGFARQAIGALTVRGWTAREPAPVTRMRVNALLAEVVTLNTLGLHRQALLAADYAQSLPGADEEPQTWLRSFLEQRLTAMAAHPRTSRYEADAIADQAHSLVPGDRVLRAGIMRRHLDIYLVRFADRTSRRTDRLADELHAAAGSEIAMSSMRRAQVLRTLIRYYLRGRGDQATAALLVSECLRVTTEAGLVHQRTALIRELT